MPLMWVGAASASLRVVAVGGAIGSTVVPCEVSDKSPGGPTRIDLVFLQAESRGEPVTDQIPTTREGGSRVATFAPPMGSAPPLPAQSGPPPGTRTPGAKSLTHAITSASTLSGHAVSTDAFFGAASGALARGALGTLLDVPSSSNRPHTPASMPARFTPDVLEASSFGPTAAGTLTGDAHGSSQRAVGRAPSRSASRLEPEASAQILVPATWGASYCVVRQRRESTAHVVSTVPGVTWLRLGSPSQDAFEAHIEVTTTKATHVCRVSAAAFRDAPTPAPWCSADDTGDTQHSITISVPRGGIDVRLFEFAADRAVQFWAASQPSESPSASAEVRDGAHLSRVTGCMGSVDCANHVDALDAALSLGLGDLESACGHWSGWRKQTRRGTSHVERKWRVLWTLYIRCHVEIDAHRPRSVLTMSDASRALWLGVAAASLRTDHQQATRAPELSPQWPLGALSRIVHSGARAAVELAPWDDRLVCLDLLVRDRGNLDFESHMLRMNQRVGMPCSDDPMLVPDYRSVSADSSNVLAAEAALTHALHLMELGEEKQ